MMNDKTRSKTERGLGKKLEILHVRDLASDRVVEVQVRVKSGTFGAIFLEEVFTAERLTDLHDLLSAKFSASLSPMSWKPYLAVEVANLSSCYDTCLQINYSAVLVGQSQDENTELRFIRVDLDDEARFPSQEDCAPARIFGNGSLADRLLRASISKQCLENTQLVEFTSERWYTMEELCRRVRSVRDMLYDMVKGYDDLDLLREDLLAKIPDRARA